MAGCREQIAVLKNQRLSIPRSFMRLRTLLHSLHTLFPVHLLSIHCVMHSCAKNRGGGGCLHYQAHAQRLVTVGKSHQNAQSFCFHGDTDLVTKCIKTHKSNHVMWLGDSMTPGVGV